MPIDSFTAAMTLTTLSNGEIRHRNVELSRQLAMTAGLTKTSDELSQAWETDPELYIVTLKGAIAAYDENQTLEYLLAKCIARLASVVDQDDEAIDQLRGSSPVIEALFDTAFSQRPV